MECFRKEIGAQGREGLAGELPRALTFDFRPEVAVPVNEGYNGPRVVEQTVFLLVTH